MTRARGRVRRRTPAAERRRPDHADEQGRSGVRGGARAPRAAATRRSGAARRARRSARSRPACSGPRSASRSSICRTAVIVTAVAGVVLGLALWLFVRWLGRHATVEHGKALARHLAEALAGVPPPERLRGVGVRRGARPHLRAARPQAEGDQRALPAALRGPAASSTTPRWCGSRRNTPRRSTEIGRQRAAETTAEEEAYAVRPRRRPSAGSTPS